MKAMKWLVAIAIIMIPLGVAISENTYVGEKKCKICHKVQHKSWAETPHAKAFEKLEAEDQAKEECLKCHATGNSADFPGVQCEACHGPGSAYKSMKIMKDREAAIAAGLQFADEAFCVACHTGAPHDQKEFNYEEAVKTGLHEFKK